MKIFFKPEDRSYLYYANARGRDICAKLNFMGRLVLRAEGWRVEPNSIFHPDGSYRFFENGFLGNGAGEGVPFIDDLRMAKRQAREMFRRIERRTYRNAFRMCRSDIFRERMSGLTSEKKVRRWSQNGELRHAPKALRYPMFIGDDFDSLPEGMEEWLNTRDCTLPTLEGTCFTTKRMTRSITHRVHDVMIDFPDRETAFEFKMRWL
jgi:hypothetical protein